MLLIKIGNLLARIGSKIYESPQQKRTSSWFRDLGDKTLRLDYDLNEQSLVFDVGGYEGQWSSDIYAMYNCHIHIFEPVEIFATNIEKRFSRNQKITVHKFGLSAKTQPIEMGFQRDSSSIFNADKNPVSATLVCAADFISQNHIETIDLMKINIEGGEYDLLDHLIASGLVARIKNIQVQFHDFVPDAETRMVNIQKELNQTHFLTYQYPFVWENWQLK